MSNLNESPQSDVDIQVDFLGEMPSTVLETDGERPFTAPPTINVYQLAQHQPQESDLSFDIVRKRKISQVVYMNDMDETPPKFFKLESTQVYAKEDIHSLLREINQKVSEQGKKLNEQGEKLSEQGKKLSEQAEQIRVLQTQEVVNILKFKNVEKSLKGEGVISSELLKSIQNIIKMGRDASLESISNELFDEPELVYVRGNQIVEFLSEETRPFDSKSKNVRKVVAQRVKDWIQSQAQGGSSSSLSEE